MHLGPALSHLRNGLTEQTAAPIPLGSSMALSGPPYDPGILFLGISHRKLTLLHKQEKYTLMFPMAKSGNDTNIHQWKNGKTCFNIVPRRNIKERKAHRQQPHKNVLET